jgi:NadR type nicotinamide-nucleotide adenylyltransferase
MIKSLVIGKFYPPHKGHSYLIDYGLKHCDNLCVVVCHRDDQSIPGRLRAKWLKEIHPKAKVIVVKDINQDDDSKAWAEYTKKFLGYNPDVVFTSENYGINYCRFLGCKHIMVDKKRKTVPISGTIIRQKPLKSWGYLHPCVQAYFAKRVCIIGAESTGTTTLAKALAQYYKTNWVPEYGRTYSEGKITTGNYSWKSEEFEHIAKTQNNSEDNLAKSCNKILICDTDSFTTGIWHERYMNYVSKKVEALSKNRHYDLYIVTADDIPFVQDGTRDGEHIRHQMHVRFIEKLKKHNKRFIIVTGTHQERMRKAIKRCNKLLGKS